MASQKSFDLDLGTKRHSKNKLSVSNSVKKILSGNERAIRVASQGITTPEIRRLMRKAGVKRLSKKSLEEAFGQIDLWLERAIHIAKIVTKRRGKKTITTKDIRYALNRLHKYHGLGPENFLGLKGDF